MKVVNLFIGSFVISSLTLNSDVLAGCCGNKNKKGNNNSSNNNGSKQTPPSKKSNSTTTTTTTTTTTSGEVPGATTSGPGFRTTTTTTTSGAKAAATTTTTPEATTTGAGLGAGFGTTTTTPEATTTGAGLGAGFGTTTSTTGATKTSTTTTVPLVEKITEIQNVGGINGLTARLEGNKIYLYLNGKKFMESTTAYSGTMEENSINDVKMKFTEQPLSNSKVCIRISNLIITIKAGEKTPIKNILKEDTLIEVPYEINGQTYNIVIDINKNNAYVEYSNVNGNVFKHYFALDLATSRVGNYFWNVYSSYGYYANDNFNQPLYYWAQPNQESSPYGNQYSFYKQNFESHTFVNNGAYQA